MAYEEHGPPQGGVIILLHGFPYDPRCFDEVAPPLATAGYRVIVPYLRGFGPTRFLSAATMRSGQQGAIAQDLLDLMDALNIERATLMGFDWGGRAACIAAALWPARVRGLVTALGYLIQDIPAAARPAAPQAEHVLWYQYYLHGPRGHAGLTANRFEFCKLLWQMWSPKWRFSDAVYQQSAQSFDNPDFVDIVTHSYRHRFGYAAGDPDLRAIETALTRQPSITTPSIIFAGDSDGVHPIAPAQTDANKFTRQRNYLTLPDIGHNIPQEAPSETVRALLELLEQ